jgi:DNA polymerase III subunit epsilon
MNGDCIFDLQRPMVQAEPNADKLRILRPLPNVTALVPKAFPEDGRVIAIVDCEATSLNSATAKVIELAVMGVIVDGAGQVVGHTPISSWLEDPGEVLSEEVKLVTRLDDEMLALSILNRTDMIIAHNAGYDAPIVERRLPTIAGKAWACSVHELDWLRLGYDGAKLGHLIMQAGWYCDGHRAAVDVAALFHLLQVQGSIGGDMPRTHLERLLEKADQPMVRIAAIRPGFGHSLELKARGYRWAPENKSWWTDMSEDDVYDEENWLRRQGIRGIDCTRQTASDRYRPPRREILQFDESEEAPF